MTDKGAWAVTDQKGQAKPGSPQGGEGLQDSPPEGSPLPPQGAGDRGLAGKEGYRAGYVAIIGAPNTGKSSLMNRYLGQKVAIVTRKPQTTRHKALGILTGPKGQIVFWDTPGIHESAKALNQGMLASAHSAMANSDVCLWLVDGLVWGLEHDKALETVKSRKGLPLVAAINKADLLEPVAIEKAIEEIRESSGAQIALAVSAKTGYGLKRLKRALVSLLPLSGPLFDEDALTDQTMRSIAAEYVREAIFERTRQEIPYSSAVTIDEFLEPAPLDNKPIFRISATIHVERDSQKKVMIGEKGQALKAIGQAARVGLERFLGAKVFLSLFVRVTDNWSDDERALADFGYLDPKGKG